MTKKIKSQANILIVDDSITNVLLLRGILEAENYSNLFTANTGKEAYKVLESEQIDLVLLDLFLPHKISGIDILKTMKADPKMESIPVIVISANNNNNEVETVKELGAVEYVHKPVNIDLLVDLVNNFFE